MALGSHWGGFGVAIGCLSTRFGVALRSHWVACAVRRFYFCFILSAFCFCLALACPGHSMLDVGCSMLDVRYPP